MKDLYPQTPKILYAIQGTGNGHVARAREIIPILQKYGEVDVVLSGDQSNIDLDYPIKYRSKGLTFVYNKSGSVSLWRSLLKNNLIKLNQEIRNFPIEEYDIIVNDFEFISAWAARRKGLKCFGLGHQASFVSENTPRPKRKDWVGEWVLKHYAPCSDPIGFHFDHFDEFIFPPVIRKGIRKLTPTKKGHYTVYLPAYSDEHIAKVLGNIPGIKWQVFSKRAKETYQKGTVEFKPVNNQHFLESFANCDGVLTSAGFETPAEALYLGKKVMVIPIKKQYEQYCNAEAIKHLGVPVVEELNTKSIGEIQNWVEHGEAIQVDFPDQIEDILRTQIFEKYAAKCLELNFETAAVIY